jgi:hypothetical protein
MHGSVDKTKLVDAVIRLGPSRHIALLVEDIQIFFHVFILRRRERRVE